jgi:ribosomal-protein-serine acetyltransferase
MLQHILTDDLSLTLLEPRHAEPLFQVVDQNRAYLREWLPWLDLTTSVDDVHAFIRRTQEQFGRNDGFQTLLTYGDEIAGVVGHHRIDWENRCTWLGYWLAESFQGRGLMTLACRAYIDHSFGALNLHRVEIHVATDNARSRAIPERLGFSCEGVLRDAEWLYDPFVDHAVYALLQPERLTTPNRTA